MVAAWGFKVSQVKALQKHESDKQSQDEIEDGGGFVFKAMVEGPVGRQGMKQVILNLPPGMPDLPEPASREPGGR